MKHFISYPIILFLFFSSLLFSQNHKIDSLRSILTNSKEDTNKVNVLNVLSGQYSLVSDYEKERELALTALALSNQLAYEKGQADALHNIAGSYSDKGNYIDALKNLNHSLEIRKKINDRKGMAGSYGNIGIIYYRLGNYPEALKNYLTSLHIKEGLKDKRGIAIAYNNIGLICREQENYQEALDNYAKSLEYSLAINDKQLIASIQANIGIIYKAQKKYIAALQSLFASLKTREEIGSKNGIAASYNNIGTVYQLMAAENEHGFKQRDSLLSIALNYYGMSLKIKRAIGDKDGVVACYINLADIYIKKGEALRATKYNDSGMVLALEMRHKERIKELYYGKAKTDSVLGNFRRGLENFKLFILFRDSILNEENTKKTVQAQMNYDFEKRQAADSIKNTEQAKQEHLKHEQEIRQQQLFTFGGIIGFALMLVVAIVSFRAYRQKQNANAIISHQKELVEEKQKEILDSIHYAKRIQRSILPTEKYIEKHLRKLK